MVRKGKEIKVTKAAMKQIEKFARARGLEDFKWLDSDFCWCSRRSSPRRYRMKKRLLLATLLIFFMVEGCAMFAKSVEAPRMTKGELKAVLGNPDFLIIDVRYGRDWTDGDLKIRGAVREDPVAIDSWANKYPKDKTLVFYCA